MMLVLINMVLNVGHHSDLKKTKKDKLIDGNELKVDLKTN